MTLTITPPTLKLDLNLKAGADATITLTVVDTLGQPITNPTGYSIRAQIRRTALGPVLFEWNSTPTPQQGTAVLSYSAGPPAQSTVALTVTDDQATLFGFRLAVWDCYLTNPAGQSTCLAAGVVRVDPQITR